MNKEQTPVWLRASELVQNHHQIDEVLYAFQEDPTDDNAVGLVATVMEVMAPPGWKLVPVEPTPEMLAACQNVEPVDIRLCRRLAEADALNNAAFYRAMVAAAPDVAG